MEKDDVKNSYYYMRCRDKAGTGRSKGCTTKQRLRAGEVGKNRDVSKSNKLQDQARRIIWNFIKRGTIAKPQECNRCGFHFRSLKDLRVHIGKITENYHSQLGFRVKKPNRFIPWRYDINEHEFLCKNCIDTRIQSSG